MWTTKNIFFAFTFLMNARKTWTDSWKPLTLSTWPFRELVNF